MKKKYHIMVADDEPSVREVLKELILAIGDEYIVYPAADSFEALHMFQSLPLDMALVDIFMPGLNGFELLKEIQGKYPQVMLVVITGQPSYQMVLEALRLGAADFLPKPIALAELRKILDKLKSAKPPTRASEEQKSGPELETLSQEVVEKIQEQHFLLSLGEELAAIRSTDEMYPFFTRMALALTGGIKSAFFLYDQEKGRLHLVSTADPPGGKVVDLPPACYHSAGELQPALSRADLVAKQALAANCLSLPLKMREEFLGVLHIYNHPGQTFAPEAVTRLQLLVDRFILTLENLTLHNSVFSNLYDTLKTLINSLEARDAYSRHHSVRVTRIAALFAGKLHLAPELIDSINLAGALHDIGKIGIPDAVLLKPDRLDPAELEIIRQHPVIGDNIVAPLNLLPRERALILHHHERWDGRGYPMGLKGEDIPFLSRLIALADAYDAITSDRPYRKRRTHQEALEELQANAGSQFDPFLTLQFVEIMGQPWAALEISRTDKELEGGQQFLSDQQFHMLVKNLTQKLSPLPGYKKFSNDFPQPDLTRSDVLS